jgi:hypothetical protein
MPQVTLAITLLQGHDTTVTFARTIAAAITPSSTRCAAAHGQHHGHFSRRMIYADIIMNFIMSFYYDFFPCI